jgi:nucleoside-diphosphate-sugar epimerase
VARILVTGAAGFIGAALCRELARRGHAVLGATRGSTEPIAGVELCPIGDIGSRTSWSGRLDRVDIVVHLATRAHRPATTADGEAEAAAALARAAAEAGVRRFVHMSSIRAMGSATRPGAPFRAADRALPGDPYGRAKLAIEGALVAAAQESGLDLVILRPPLVHGPGVKGNLQALVRLAASGLPLPFAGVDNRRSLIFVGNLVDLVAAACTHPDAAGRVLLARDAVDLSTPELIRALAAGLGRKARLFAVPPPAFAALSRLPALGSAVARLTSSLQVDDSETRRGLGWSPAVTAEAGLAATARAYRGSRESDIAGCRGVLSRPIADGKKPMTALTEDTTLIRHAIAYVIELYRELTEENGAPGPGTQSQAVDFILADPELRAAIAEWGRKAQIDEATTEPPRRLPGGAAHHRIRAYLRSVMEQPVFTRPAQEPGDRR